MRGIVWLCFAALAAFYICGPVADPDLWWHITVGRWILANQTIPHVDYWGMFSAGTHWRAYSWLSEIIFALVDSGFGERGLLILQMFFALLLSLSLFWCFSKISQDWFFGGLLGFLVTAAVFNHFSLRPQVLVWIVFAVLLWTAVRIEREGLDWKKGSQLFLLMLLWANTHVSSVLGILAVMFWLSSPHSGRQAALAGLICFLGTLATPYLGGEWLTLIGKGLHPFSHSSILEFQPATILQRSTGLFLVLLACFLAFLHFRPAALGRAKPCGALLFTLLALAVVKFQPFAGIFVAACLAQMWQGEGSDRKELGNISTAVEKLRRLLEETPREGLAFLLLCLCLVNGFRAWREKTPESIRPEAAVDFIIENRLPFPLLNDFGSGGYIMYRLSDRAGNLAHKVSLDGRTNLISSELWEKKKAALRGWPAWREYIDAVKPATILWLTRAPLSSILLSAGEWCRVKKSGGESGFSVFVKRAEFEARRSELMSDNCK